MLRIVDYKLPKTGEVLKVYRGHEWCKVKWFNDKTEILYRNDKARIFKGEKRYELIEK